MSSYVWWVGEQLAKSTSTWVAANPAEASLIAAALANPATRGFTLDVLRVVARETGRSWLNISRGVISSAASRSTMAARLGAWLSRARLLVVNNPITAVGTSLVVVGTVYANASAATEHGFAAPASSGIGMPPSTTVGGFDDFWGFGS